MPDLTFLPVWFRVLLGVLAYSYLAAVFGCISLGWLPRLIGDRRA